MTGYVRLQSDRISTRTGKPQGFFAAAHFLKQGNALSESERSEIAEIEEWFEANIPDPPFYKEGNEIRAITWFKAESSDAIDKARAVVRILLQHGIKMAEVYSEASSFRNWEYVELFSKERFQILPVRTI